MGNRIPRGPAPKRSIRREPSRPNPKGPAEEAILVPCCIIATTCLSVFGLGRASPIMLAVLLVAILSIGTPAFMALRRRWLSESDRGRRGWLGILAGLLLLSSMAATLAVCEALLS